MTEVSQYSLNLYCDHSDQLSDPECWNFRYWPTAFIAENREAAVNDAKESGWVFHENGTHSCSFCESKGIPGESILEQE